MTKISTMSTHQVRPDFPPYGTNDLQQINMPVDRLRTTRRAFLQHLAIASAIGLSGCIAGHEMAQPTHFSFAPATTEVTARSAMVWLRTSQPTSLQVVYGTDPNLAQATHSPIVQVTATTDYTMAIELVQSQAGSGLFLSRYHTKRRAGTG